MRQMFLASLLLAPLALPAAAVASQPAIDASASTQLPQVSTGLSPVRVTHHPRKIGVPDVSLIDGFPTNAEVILKLKVNKRGQARDIRIVNTDDPYLDAPVIAAVHQFRWRPARLDHHAVTDGVKLIVLVKQ
jgi:hypothetical protein